MAKNLAMSRKELRVEPVCWLLKLSVMPAILRSSKFFLDSEDPAQIRAVHPLECIGMQTIPVLLPKQHPALAVCDFEDVVAKAKVELLKLQAFSGNGMNAACVGKLIVGKLAGTSWRPR